MNTVIWREIGVSKANYYEQCECGCLGSFRFNFGSEAKLYAFRKQSRRAIEMTAQYLTLTTYWAFSPASYENIGIASFFYFTHNARKRQEVAISD